MITALRKRFDHKVTLPVSVIIIASSSIFFDILSVKSSDKEIIMVAKEVNAEPLDSDAVCPVCHHTGAYYLLKQTRSADEPETKFYTCESCGHRWREY